MEREKKTGCWTFEISCNVEKCARKGCHQDRSVGSLFCLACDSTGKNGPNTTCDALPALRDMN